MKILFVIEGGLPYGSNRSLLVLVERFRKMGLEVFVAGKRNGAMKAWVEAAGATFFPAYISFLTWPRSDTPIRKALFPAFVAGRIAMNLIAFPAMVAMCLKIRPDVIHTNVGPVSVGYYVARWLGIRHVWHLREFQDLDFGMRFFPTKIAYLRRLDRSDAVVCVSKAVARHFGRPEGSVIYNGVGSGSCVPAIGEKERCFLLVANLQPAKGVETVISAYLEFMARRAADYTLLIVGGGEPAHVAHARELAREGIDKGLVRLLGYVDDVAALMRKSKAVIVASPHEAFGRVAAEAMFNGCLVIGRRSAGTAELLEPWNGGEVGLLFSDKDSLIQRMIDVASMKDDHYLRIAALAQAKAVDCFSIEDHSARIFSLYERLARCSQDRKNGTSQTR